MTFAVPSKKIISPPRSASAADCPSRHYGSGSSLTPLVLPQIGTRSDSPTPASSPSCPQPPGLLPRTVAPPTTQASASSGMEAMWEARISRQTPCLGNTRDSGSLSGLGFHQAPQELPPLRDTRAMSPIPCRGELDFLCDRARDPLRGDLKTPGGRLSLRSSPNVRQSAPAGRVPQVDVRTECDDRVASQSQEVDNLKRQLSRLTQLRRDRDNYIQDLLTEAEAMRRRHETEIGRHAMRTQREAVERLSAQQLEHDQHLEERSRAHAAALAQQAWQHEREIEELRKSLRIDGERRQAERLAESANLYREMLLRLQLTAEELRQRLVSHLVATGESALGEDDALLLSKDTSVTTEAAAGATVGSSSSLACSSSCGQLRALRRTTAEPEPEEQGAAPSTLDSLTPQSLAEQEAVAEHAAMEAAEGAERAIMLVHKDLERVLLAGRVVAEHRAEERKSQLQETSKLEQQQMEAKALRERERRTLCHKAQEFAAGAASAHSQTLLLKVLLVWSKDVQRQRSLEGEQQRALSAAAQQEKLMAACQKAESLRCRLSGELKTQGTRLGKIHTGFLKRVMLFRWAVSTREARREAAHRRQLITAAADASAEVYKLRAEAKKVSVELRKQRRAHGVAAIHANLDRRLQSVLLAWSAVVREGQREASYQRQLDIAAAESAAGCAVLRMEGRRTARELREQRRRQGLHAIESDCRYWQHMTLRAWLAEASSSKRQVRWEESLAEERLQSAARVVEAEARRRAELRDQAADCEARIEAVQASFSAAGADAEAPSQRADLQHAADMRAQEVHTEAESSELVRLCAEREALQAQIENLHDELRRVHGQP